MLAAILIIVGLIIALLEKGSLFKKPVTFPKVLIIILLIASAIVSFLKEHTDGKKQNEADKVIDSLNIKTNLLSIQLSNLERDNRVAQKVYSNELSSVREYIVDSMTSIYSKEGQRQANFRAANEARQKKQIDSIEASRQRRLSPIDKSRLIKRIENIIKENNLSKNVPITIGRPAGNHEARVYAHEVHDFLKAKGYNLIYEKNFIGDGTIGDTSGNEINGFSIFYFSQLRQIAIDVGPLGSRP